MNIKGFRMLETPEPQVKFVGKGGLMAIVVVMIILVVSNIWSFSQLSTLESELTSSSEKYDTLSSYYKGLSQNVSDLYDFLYSYSSIPEAFSRTLNEVSVNEVSSVVLSVTGSSSGLWSSCQKIYDYITLNIEYVNDIDMPYPSTYWHINIDGFDYIINFSITTCRNYVQKPSLTLEIKQGDCDDQAVLAYAMTKYYMKYIGGTVYRLYIAFIDYSDDTAHLAVILPVQGGNVCIMDPAGNYLTSSMGTITSKPAQSELQAYSDYWSSTGSIKYIKLYDVSIQDGNYSIAAEGTINQIATFLAQD